METLKPNDDRRLLEELLTLLQRVRVTTSMTDNNWEFFKGITDRLQDYLKLDVPTGTTQEVKALGSTDAVLQDLADQAEVYYEVLGADPGERGNAIGFTRRSRLKQCLTGHPRVTELVEITRAQYEESVPDVHARQQEFVPNRTLDNRPRAGKHWRVVRQDLNTFELRQVGAPQPTKHAPQAKEAPPRTVKLVLELRDVPSGSRVTTVGGTGHLVVRSRLRIFLHGTKDICTVEPAPGRLLLVNALGNAREYPESKQVILEVPEYQLNSTWQDIIQRRDARLLKEKGQTHGS